MQYFINKLAILTMITLTSMSFAMESPCFSGEERERSLNKAWEIYTIQKDKHYQGLLECEWFIRDCAKEGKTPEQYIQKSLEIHEKSKATFFKYTTTNVTEQEMQALFDQYGFIVLRHPDLNLEKLVLACGNCPACSSYCDWERQYHAHEGFITIDEYLMMNPYIVGAFPSVWNGFRGQPSQLGDINVLRYLIDCGFSKKFKIIHIEGYNLLNDIGNPKPEDKSLEFVLPILSDDGVIQNWDTEITQADITRWKAAHPWYQG